MVVVTTATMVQVVDLVAVALSIQEQVVQALLVKVMLLATL